MKPISIIIISYNRPADAMELLTNLVQLEAADRLVEEVILLNNASTESYAEVADFCKAQHPFIINYVNPGTNLGVARGRNYAIRESRAPVLLMLDDDAVLGNKDALVHVASSFLQKKDKPLGALACKVLYYDTHEFQVNAFPHKQFERLKEKRSFETYYFTGCAHALSRAALEHTGLYPEDFFYGMEEYDLSYRLLSAGYRISYNSEVVLLHKESPLGRAPKAEKLQMMWVNKTKVAWRYLYLHHFISTAVIWSFYFLKNSGWAWRMFFGGWKTVMDIPNREKKYTVTPRVMHYLHTLRARLWY